MKESYEQTYIFRNEKDDYRFLIISDYTEFEAYIKRRDQPNWELMFGMPKQNKTEITLDQFIKIVRNNVDEYIAGYEEDYGEELPF